MGTPELSTENALAFQIESSRKARGSAVFDIIVAVDGRRVAAADDLARCLRRLTGGDAVDLTVLRDGERLQLPATLGTHTL